MGALTRSPGTPRYPGVGHEVTVLLGRRNVRFVLAFVAVGIAATGVLIRLNASPPHFDEFCLQPDVRCPPDALIPTYGATSLVTGSSHLVTAAFLCALVGIFACAAAGTAIRRTHRSVVAAQGRSASAAGRLAVAHGLVVALVTFLLVAGVLAVAMLGTSVAGFGTVSPGFARMSWVTGGAAVGSGVAGAVAFLAGWNWRSNPLVLALATLVYLALTSAGSAFLPVFDDNPTYMAALNRPLEYLQSGGPLSWLISGRGPRIILGQPSHARIVAGFTVLVALGLMIALAPAVFRRRRFEAAC